MSWMDLLYAAGLLTAVVAVARAVDYALWWTVPILDGDITCWRAGEPCSAVDVDQDGVYLVTGFADPNRDGYYRLPLKGQAS